jgi:hypothetical protein
MSSLIIFNPVFEYVVPTYMTLGGTNSPFKDGPGAMNATVEAVLLLATTYSNLEESSSNFVISDSQYFLHEP